FIASLRRRLRAVIGAAPAGATPGLTRRCVTGGFAPMSEAPSPNIPNWATYWRITAVCAGVAVLLGVSGAFNTAQRDVVLRTTYWLALMLPGVAIAIGAGNVLGRVFHIDGPWSLGIGIVVATTLLQTPLVLLFNRLMLGTEITWPRTLGVIPSIFAVAAALT